MAPIDAPSLSFGAGFLPDDRSETAKMFALLEKHGVPEIDTARIYRRGESEEIIRDLGANEKFKITTKVSGFFPGSGKRENVLKSAKESLEALGVDRVPIYLLHAPDDTVPFEETLEAIQQLYKEGKFEKFGLSNFTAAEVRSIHAISKKNNYVLPTVYQSNYNLVARHNEKILFPTLRELGIKIQVYSPIAGGFLVKSPEELSAAGDRWDPTSFAGKLYHGLYNKPSLIEFLGEFGKLSQESGVGKVALAYRWVVYHSELRAGDTVILGAKNAQQLEQTLRVVEEGPLEEGVAKRLDEMWKMVEGEAPTDNFESMRSKAE